MRILFLQPQPCIRALKYAKGLKNVLKDEISLIFGYLHRTLTQLYGHGDELFDAFIKLNPRNLENDIKSLVRKYRPDIIHSHNAPDFLTVSAVRAVDDVPIIHDNHDVLSLRRTGYYAHDTEEDILIYKEQEKIANEESDGRIYATEEIQKYIQQRYEVDPSKELVFHNYISESMIPTSFNRKISSTNGQIHVVYIGNVSSGIEGSHYDLKDIFREIAEHGIHIHIYTTYENMDCKRLAEKSKLIHYHGHLDQRTLLQEITKYDFGWAGFNTTKNKAHVDAALPHKVIEYISCGLPVLAFPHKTIKRFLERHRVGIVFNSMEELIEKLKDTKELEKIKRNVLKTRRKFTVEANINRVLTLYKALT